MSAAVRQWPPNVTDGQSLPLAAGEPAYEGHALAAVTGGRLLRSSNRPIRGGAVDSRRTHAGNAFFALPGERTDGQRFVADAIRAGAAAVVLRDAPSEAELDGLEALHPHGATIIQVTDAADALRAIAAHWRARFDPIVVGVTGSLAKTSTKEQIAEVLSTRWVTLRSEGNENNEIGLPLTLLRMGREHRAAVLEMGLYVQGDISLLASLARPSIGVVTAVRGVHLSRAGTLAAIARGKRELVEALPASGTAVLNADDPLVLAMASSTPATVLSYGFDARADVTAEDVRSEGIDGMRFRLRLPTEATDVRTPALGRHSVHNALGAAAVGIAAGLDAAAIADGLRRGFRAPHRTQLVDAGRWRVLDDSYNAAPDSMIAALTLLAELPGRRVAVLGEMLELGDASEAAHRLVGAGASSRADRLIVVGEAASAIADGARTAGMPTGAVIVVPDRDRALEALLAEARDGDTILVKASRGAALDQLVEALVKAGGAGAAA
jgi:UDP-N-acetylmuramoyl-tripeptide--D-alanyl-D-alanine ligase